MQSGGKIAVSLLAECGTLIELPEYVNGIDLLLQKTGSL